MVRDPRNNTVVSSLSFLFCFMNLTLVSEKASYKRNVNGQQLKNPKQKPIFSQLKDQETAWQSRKHLNNNHFTTVKHYRKKLTPCGELRLLHLPDCHRCLNPLTSVRESRLGAGTSLSQQFAPLFPPPHNASGDQIRTWDFLPHPVVRRQQFSPHWSDVHGDYWGSSNKALLLFPDLSPSISIITINVNSLRLTKYLKTRVFLDYRNIIAYTIIKICPIFIFVNCTIIYLLLGCNCVQLISYIFTWCK